MPVCSNCGRDNPADARFCNNCGAPLAPPARPQEERKVVTVLFCDLVGFTARSEQADPEDVRATLRAYHDRMRREIERFGGTVEKFIGDAVMAVFGAPVAHEDDAERAVRSGLRILESVPELNETHPGLDLAVRIGINTGEAVVALGARPSEGEGMVAGDVVNTAARLQGAAPVGGIVVGEVTHRATKDVIDYEPLDPVTVKGKAAPVPIWRAVQARSRFGMDLGEGPAAPFVGRDDDLALLSQTFSRTLRERSVQLVTVTGEPGVGKSRLVAEFRRYVDDLPDLVYWRQGRCLPYGEGITFWALSEVVKAHAGILESDRPEEASDKLGQSVEALVEDPSEREWVQARLAPLVGASSAQSGGPADRAESFAAWQRFLEAVAADGPLVLVFEDLHWADPAMFEFVEHLVDWSSGVPMMAICSARPELYERHPGWGGGKRNSTTIGLSALSEEDTARLISSLLEQSALPAEIQAALIERSGGNPLYAEEFVRMLVDRGFLERRGRALVLASGAEEIPFPESVHALIAARLDTLPPERKAILQDAAVVGKVFWSGAVASIGDREEPDVRLGLHELSKKELVRPARRSSVRDQAEYAFWHLLVRDVAYGQMPRAARARKHRLAAEWMERLAEDRVTDLAELLAHHYGQALDLARAAGSSDEVPELERRVVRFLIMAGDRAINLDVESAGGYYRRALELLPEDAAEVAGVLARLAEVAELRGDLKEAVPLYERAIAGLGAQGDRVAQGDAMVKLGYLLWNQGEGVRSREVMAEAVALLEAEPPGQELVAAYEQMGAMTYIGGDPQQGLEWSEKALAVAGRVGRERQAVRAIQVRGMCRFEFGDMGGLADMWEAVRRAEELGLGHETVRSYHNLGVMVSLEEGPAKEAELLGQAVEVAERRGIKYRGIWAKQGLMWDKFALGQWEELPAALDELVEWDETHGSSQVGHSARELKMRLLIKLGRFEEAAPLAREVLSGARKIGDPQTVVPALCHVAELEVARGRPSEGVALVREVIALTEGRPAWRVFALADLMWVVTRGGALELGEELLGELPENPKTWERYDILTARALYTEAAGRLQEALDLHSEAAQRWEGFGIVLRRAEALLGAARCLVGLGRNGEAREPLLEARQIFARLGARPLLEETDALLERATALTS